MCIIPVKELMKVTLEEKSLEIRKLIACSVSSGAEGGETLCFADALTALCHGVMRYREQEPDWPDRDRLVLPPLLCGLALPGLSAVAGAAGESAALAVDMALRARAEIKIYRSFALISQADCLSGRLWESAIRAHENMLEDLTVILCRKSGDILPGADNICAKFSAFGFDTFSVEGDNVSAIGLALSLPRHSGKPLFVCCDVK